MSIRRGKRPDTRFYTLNKDISEDTRLSWAARGMLIFLLGKPDNWTVSVAHLMKQTDKSARPSSRDAVRAIINELITAGYMKADTAREGGKFRGIDYVVSESPETDFPAPAEPDTPETDNPAPVEPLPANPPLTNNDLKQGMINPAKTDLPAPQNCAAAEGQFPVPAVLSNQQHQDQNDHADPPYEKIREVFWRRFDAAYQEKYGTVLPRNAKTNSQVKQLIQRLGKEAPAVACFYVNNVNETRVTMASHTLDFLLLNAEGYRTQWATGRAMTQGRARQIDSTQTNMNVADEAIAMLRAKRAREAGSADE